MFVRHFMFKELRMPVVEIRRTDHTRAAIALEVVVAVLVGLFLHQPQRLYGPDAGRRGRRPRFVA